MQEFFDRHHDQFIIWLNSHWRIEFDRVRQDIKIEGSPERTLSRAVIQDTKGDLFLLEKFSREKFTIREKVARAVQYLRIGSKIT